MKFDERGAITLDIDDRWLFPTNFGQLSHDSVVAMYGNLSQQFIDAISIECDRVTAKTSYTGDINVAMQSYADPFTTYLAEKLIVLSGITAVYLEGSGY